MRGMKLLTLSVMLVAPAAAAQEVLPAALDAGFTSPSPRGVHILFTEEVFDDLEFLADTLRVETVRCLIGMVMGDTLLVDLAWKPPIHHSTPNSVAYRPCPVATIVLWHNHPWTRDNEPEYSCYLSQTDIREAILAGAPPIQMVQVTGEVACWWTRAQVTAQAGAPVMRPLPQQARGRFDLWNTFACESEPERVVCSRQALGTGLRNPR